MTMTKRKEEKFSLLHSKNKPTSNEFSGRKEYDESKFNPIKVNIDCDRSTNETVLLDGSKSSVISSVEYDKQKQQYSILDRFDIHMQENRKMQRKETLGTQTSVHRKHQESSTQGNDRCADTKLETGIIVNIESIDGKNRVVTTRELSALKISPQTNASQIAGHRLYDQAQQRSQRIAYLRQVLRSSSPAMKLDTQRYETPPNWGVSPSKRFLALYEQGKNRLSSERQMRKELSEESMQPSLNEITAKYANVRLVNLYQHGRQKLIERKRQLDVITKDRARVSAVKIVARYANVRQQQLYELGKRRVEKGRDLNDKMKHTQKYVYYNARYASTRESELHNLGKRKITKSRDREREKRMKVRHALSVEDLASLRPNRRQILLSELGRQNIINQRLNAERQKEKEREKLMKVRHALSVEDLASLRPNRRQILLSELGRQNIVNQRLNAEHQKEKHDLFSSVEDLASLRPNRRQILLSELGRQNIINQRLNAEHQKEKHNLFSCQLPHRFG